jgi:AcrR family transcriptional regulator
MGRPKSYDRAEVLDRATRLFWDKGYEGAHLRELVKVTGISRFSLYQEFGSKEGLFKEAISTYIEGLGGLAALLTREPLGLDNIRDFHRGLLDFGFQHGCFALNTIREKNVVPESVFAAVTGLIEGDEKQIRRNLEAALERGDLSDDVDLEGQAKFITAFGIGLLSYGIVEPARDGLERMVAGLDGLWV